MLELSEIEKQFLSDHNKLISRLINKSNKCNDTPQPIAISSITFFVMALLTILMESFYGGFMKFENSEIEYLYIMKMGLLVISIIMYLYTLCLVGPKYKHVSSMDLDSIMMEMEYTTLRREVRLWRCSQILRFCVTRRFIKADHLIQPLIYTTICNSSFLALTFLDFAFTSDRKSIGLTLAFGIIIFGSPIASLISLKRWCHTYYIEVLRQLQMRKFLEIQMPMAQFCLSRMILHWLYCFYDYQNEEELLLRMRGYQECTPLMNDPKNRDRISIIHSPIGMNSPGGQKFLEEIDELSLNVNGDLPIPNVILIAGDDENKQVMNGGLKK
jgi:hypothetical protein